MKHSSFFRIICLALIFTMLLGIFPAYAWGGSIGNGLTWEIVGTDLIISGNSFIPDYQQRKAPWYFYDGAFDRIVLSDGITGIGTFAFADLEYTTEVVLPQSLEFISRRAFSDCDALEFIYIPEGVTSLSSYSFMDCDNLKAVYVPSTVSSSYSFYPFDGCYNLETIYGVPGTDAEWLADNVGAEFVEAQVTGLTLVSAPSRTEYMLGSELDTTGMEIALEYNNGLFTVPVFSGFQLSGYNPDSAGTQTITVSSGSYSASFSVTVYTRTDYVSDISLDSPPDKLNYNTSDKALDPTGGQILVTYRDGTTETLDLMSYMVSGFDTTSIGTKTLTVSLLGHTCTFDISISQAPDVSLQIAVTERCIFTGEPLEPPVSVSLDGQLLTQGTDYTVSYSNNINASEQAVITITGLGTYEGLQQSALFTIARKNIYGISGSLSSAQYTGKRVTPGGTLTLDGVELVRGQDYILNCIENAAKGTGTAQIIGIGNYIGLAEKGFTISYSQSGPTVTKDAKTAGNFSQTMAGGTLRMNVPGEVLYGYTLWRGNTLVSNFSASRPSPTSGTSYSINFSNLGPGTYTLLHSVSSYTVTVRNVNGSYQYVYEPKSTIASGKGTITVPDNSPSLVNASSLVARPAIEVTADTLVLPVNANPSNANVFPLTWTSSNTSIARVYDGVVTIVGTGDVTITASYKGSKATWNMTLEPLDLATHGQILNYNPETGKAEVYWKGWLLKEGTNYTLSTTTEGQRTTVTASGIGIYGGSTSIHVYADTGLPYGCNHTYGPWLAQDSCHHITGCTICGAANSEPHLWDDGSVTEATCSTDGSVLYTCTVCGETAQQSLPQNGNHVGTWTALTAATCSAGGTEQTVCDLCEKTVTRSTQPDPNAHVWNEGVVTTKPTAIKDGLMTVTCSLCGTTDTQVIPATGFVDVIKGKFYYSAVMWAVENGITSGTSSTTFEPDASCTRGQVVTFLWRAAGSPAPTSTEHPFTDVKEKAYYYKAMLWAVENGITAGTSKTTFEPDAQCTRGQVVTFLWRAMGKPAPSGSQHTFNDIRENGFYYKAMLWAVENGVTAGTSKTTFEPETTCTRGQVVTFLYRCYK